MATAIPPALRAADIARFAQRAGQVEKARPAIAYWCKLFRELPKRKADQEGNYWIVDRIIANGLHKADDDSKSYTMQLMDKLEQAKLDFSENDAIVDDMAGHAYVEQFGQETFQRADNAMSASKASRQTADTFQAAATFLELCQIWGPLNPEVASKIKFAKYHALRIAKAIKAGEDPNISNPHPEPSPAIESPSLDKDDPEVQKLSSPSKLNLQPSVEDVPEDRSFQYSLPSQGLQGQSENIPCSSAAPQVSPLALPGESHPVADGGEYFPEELDAVETSMDNETASENTARSVAPSSPTPIDATPYPYAPSPNAVHLLRRSNLEKSELSPIPPPSEPIQQPQPRNSGDSRPHASAERPISAISSTTHQQFINSNNINTKLRDDEAAIAAAQKHAKFAISALSFEDVKTAVNELEEALNVLGAR